MTHALIPDREIDHRSSSLWDAYTLYIHGDHAAHTLHLVDFDSDVPVTADFCSGIVAGIQGTSSLSFEIYQWLFSRMSLWNPESFKQIGSYQGIVHTKEYTLEIIGLACHTKSILMNVNTNKSSN